MRNPVAIACRLVMLTAMLTGAITAVPGIAAASAPMTATGSPSGGSQAASAGSAATASTAKSSTSPSAAGKGTHGRSKPRGGTYCHLGQLSTRCRTALRTTGAPLVRSAASQPKALAATYASSDTVTTPHGDTLTLASVETGIPWSTSLLASYVNGQNYVYCGGSASFYSGDTYDPCGKITFTDVQTGTKAPTNNSATDIEYDACGNAVSSTTSYGWYSVNDPTGAFDSGGWVGGYNEVVPQSIQPGCAGTWTIVYSFTETFSDGDTATVTAAGTFFVSPTQVIAPTETQGGGNPSELACQACTGDPVNTGTGDYVESSTDLAIGGRGPGLQMTRTYSSLAAAAGETSALGAGWSFSYGMSLAVDSGTGAATITDGNGSQTVFTSSSGTYQAPARVLATLVKNSDGSYTYTVRQRTIYTFSSAGQLMTIADLDGNKITMSYSSSGQLQSAADGAGRSLTFAYDPSGLLASVTDPSGRKVSYGHDSAGNLTSVTDVTGGVWGYGYDSNHLMLQRTDANGNVATTNTYDSAGRTLTQTNALNNETTFAYNGNPSSATTVTDPNGHVTEYDYTNGLLVRRIRAEGTPLQATWSYSYDTHGSMGLTEVTDPNGHSTSYTYDAQGNQTGSTDALNKTTSSTYDSLDDLTAHTDANGVTTTYTYDAKGNLLTKSTPLASATNQVVTYTYGDASHPGDLTAVKDPDGHTTTFTYDSAGDRASATDAAGDKTTYPTYNLIGKPTSMVSPRGNVSNGNPGQFTTTYSYDAAGRLLARTDPLGHTTTQTYDADGNLLTVTDARKNPTAYAYDADNRRIKVTRADNSTLQTGYDAVGNMTSQTDGANNATTYTYDALDHLASSTDPLNRTTTYGYDAVGNLDSVTDPLSRTTTYGYDADDRLSTINYSDGTTPSVSYGYDADGRRTSMTDGSGASTYTYDPLGRLTNTVDGHGNTTAFGYDLANNQTSITYPNGQTVTRTFDAANRTATLADWLRDKTTFGYDPDSDLTSTVLPKNTDTTSYNNADQLTGIQSAQSRTTLATLSYTRDPNGQVSSEATTGLPGTGQNYSYNNLNQLTQAGAATYAYDAGDNPTTVASATGFSYDPANELTQDPTSSYNYNPLGQRTSVTPANGTGRGYAYNQAGDLTSVSGTATTTYGYDGDGLRVAKTSGGTTTNYAWDHSSANPLLLSDGSTSYIYGPDGAPLEQITGSGTVTYYHHDQLGSTRLLTSSSGATVATFSYSPYGKLTGSTGTTTTPLGFAGQYTDAETGLVYLRARYYDPNTGQFLTRDPLGALTRERYSYATDNPLANTDPTGLCDINPFGSDSCIGDAAAGVASGGQAAGDFIGDNWRPIAQAAGDVATAGACIYSAGTLCGEAIATNAALQAGLVATGPGSAATKVAEVGANLLLAGGAAVGAGATQYLDELEALNNAYAPAAWVRPALGVAGAAPYLGYTAAQLYSYPWSLC